MQRDQRLLSKLKKLIPTLDEYEKMYGLPKGILFGILFVEHQQYSLHNISCVLKTIKNKLCKIDSFNKVAGQYMKFSVGFCHIKQHTARQALKYVTFNEEHINIMNTNTIASIDVMSNILVAFINQWCFKYPYIAEDIGVLSTLYNISEFNKQPHANPKPGGSELPLYLDGIYYESLPFATRVQLVITSQLYNNYMREYYDRSTISAAY